MPRATTTALEPSGLVARLSLAETSGRWQYGLYRGYPIAATVFAGSPEIERAGLYFDNLGEGLSSAPIMLSVQIRHPLTDADLPKGPVYQIDGRLEELILAKDAKLKVEDRIAWLDIDLRRCETAEDAEQLITDAIDVLAAAGVGHGDGLCHYCRTNLAPDISFVDGRVAAICPQCLTDREMKAKQAHAAKPIAPSKLLFGALLGSLFGGIAWGLCWFIMNFIVMAAAKSNGTPRLPTILLLGTCFVSVLAIVNPIVWLIGRARSRSASLSIITAIAASFGAYLLGEFVFGFTVVAYELGQISLLKGALAGIVLWSAWSGAYVFCRAIAVLCVLIGTPYLVAKQARKQRAAPAL